MLLDLVDTGLYELGERAGCKADVLIGTAVVKANLILVVVGDGAAAEAGVVTVSVQFIPLFGS